MNDTIISTNQLKQFVERIENLENNKADILTDIKEVYDEAKSHGFDVKIMRQIIKIKRMGTAKLAEQESLLELYRDALGI